MLPTLRLAVFLVFFWALPALAQSPAAPVWIGQMREGGFVIVMRHSATHADQVDAKPFDPSDIVHQRQLNDQGRATARIMGAALQGAGLCGADKPLSSRRRDGDAVGLRQRERDRRPHRGWHGAGGPTASTCAS